MKGNVMTSCINPHRPQEGSRSGIPEDLMSAILMIKHQPRRIPLGDPREFDVIKYILKVKRNTTKTKIVKCSSKPMGKQRRRSILGTIYASGATAAVIYMRHVFLVWCIHLNSSTL